MRTAAAEVKNPAQAKDRVQPSHLLNAALAEPEGPDVRPVRQQLNARRK